MPHIRPAVAADAKALAELQEATFRSTFGASNSAENMDMHCRLSYGEHIQRAELEDPALHILVAEHDGRLVAFAQLRMGHAPGCITATHAGEIQRLYVADDWHGKGLAQALMDACTGELRRQNADAAWLGVWEHNPRAIAFYRKCGFTEVGEHVFVLGEDPQRDVLMIRPLPGH
ncbi:MAG: GNAT family N-acetyltransferase [Arenimonas sp.]|nr:GNAT family N-acetyltransferase [Arenimonas sp.]